MFIRLSKIKRIKPLAGESLGKQSHWFIPQNTGTYNIPVVNLYKQNYSMFTPLIYNFSANVYNKTQRKFFE